GPGSARRARAGQRLSPPEPGAGGPPCRGCPPSRRVDVQPVALAPWALDRSGCPCCLVTDGMSEVACDWPLHAGVASGTLAGCGPAVPGWLTCGGPSFPAWEHP